jgi:hypothetical protein
MIFIWGSHHYIALQHLSAARLQSLPQGQAKDLRLSSAALGRLNIYLAFIGRKILAKGSLCHKPGRGISG